MLFEVYALLTPESELGGTPGMTVVVETLSSDEMLGARELSIS